MKKSIHYLIVFLLLCVLTIPAMAQMQDASLAKTSITATADSHSITLHWVPVINAAGYYAYIKPQSAATWTQNAQTSGTSISFNNLEAGPYDIAVWAYSMMNGQMAYAREWAISSATVTAPPVAPVPVIGGGMQPSGNSPELTLIPYLKGIGLKWIPAIGAAGYLVSQRFSNGQWHEVVATPNTFFNVGNLQNGVNYEFMITPYTMSANGQTQNMNAVYIGRGVPADTAKPIVSFTVNGNQATFQWVPVIGVSGYIVAFKPSNSEGYTERYEQIETYRTFTNLERGVEYLFVIQPYTYVNGTMIKSDNFDKITFVP